MASQDQMNQMLILLQQQMSQLQTLHAENTELRASAVDPTTTKAKTKAPDRPTRTQTSVNGNCLKIHGLVIKT